MRFVVDFIRQLPFLLRFYFFFVLCSFLFYFVFAIFFMFLIVFHSFCACSTLDEVKLKEKGRTFNDLFLTKVFKQRRFRLGMLISVKLI